VKPVLTGMAIGATICAMLLAVVGGIATRKTALDGRRGWNLLPVVVAAADLPEGEVLTAGKVSQRSFPEQFVGPSNVKPDEVKVLFNRKVSVPVQAGDPLLWTMFIEVDGAKQVDDCLKQIHPAVEQAHSEAAKNAVNDFKPEHPKPSPQPKSTPDAEGNVQVVAASDDLKEGDTLRHSDLKVVAMHQSLMTDSVVPASALAKLSGLKVQVPLSAGEVVLWQQIDPGGPLACLMAISTASKTTCEQAAADAVSGLKEGAQ
jgi:Flp pilus assembly protein CpaB